MWLFGRARFTGLSSAKTETWPADFSLCPVPAVRLPRSSSSLPSLTPTSIGRRSRWSPPRRLPSYRPRSTAVRRRLRSSRARAAIPALPPTWTPAARIHDHPSTDRTIQNCRTTFIIFFTSSPVDVQSISQKWHVQTPRNLLHVLPMAMARSSSDDSALSLCTSVLWTTQCFVEFGRWRHRGRSLMSMIALLCTKLKAIHALLGR